MLRIVVIKFIAPNIEEIPAKCKLKIAKSTEPPEWKAIDDKGGYQESCLPQKESQKEFQFYRKTQPLSRLFGLYLNLSKKEGRGSFKKRE